MRSRPATSRSTSGPRKLKCHSIGLLMISSHGPMPGKGASITTHLARALRILRGKRIADHIADVVGDEIGPVDLQRVHHLRYVARLRFLLVSALWMGREADAPQVGNDHFVLADERRRDGRPHVAGVAEAMEEDDRGPSAADADIDRRPVHLDVFRDESPMETA